MQVLWHADLSPDQLLGAIAGWYPNLRDPRGLMGGGSSVRHRRHPSDTKG